MSSPISTIIREQDPLKQGLKPTDTVMISTVFIIREQDPLKQGLKLPLIHEITRVSDS